MIDLIKNVAPGELNMNTATGKFIYQVIFGDDWKSRLNAIFSA